MARTTWVDYSTVLTADYMNDVDQMVYGTNQNFQTTWRLTPTDTNSSGTLSIGPSGTNTNSFFETKNASDPVNYHFVSISCNSTAGDIHCGAMGDQYITAFPLRFYTYDENNVLYETLRMYKGHMILPKYAGYGFKVDQANPTFGWRDITATVQPKTTGAGAPTRAIYAGGNLAQYSFALNDVCEFEFHIPHDYVPGTDLYFHVHWSHTGTTISGSAVFTAYYTYASGHNTMTFPAEKTLTITKSTPDVATVPQYSHRIDEVIMTGPSATATLTDRDTIEVDGLVLVTLKLTTLPTLGGGGKLFVHTADIHYQSSNMATKQRAPDFYV